MFLTVSYFMHYLGTILLLQLHQLKTQLQNQQFILQTKPYNATCLQCMHVYKTSHLCSYSIYTTCVNKSIGYSSGKTSNVFKDTTSLPLKSDNDQEDDGSFGNDAE